MDQDNNSFPPANDGVQRVEVETETDSVSGARDGRNAGAGRGFAFRFGRAGSGGFHAFASGDPNAPLGKPPTAAAWICLVLAWLFLGSSIPFTVFLGVPLALAAVLLGAVCLSRGGMFSGLAVILLGSAGSFVVYLVGLFRFLAG